MKKAYIILGMKRSGHHAIAYWIAHNLNTPSMFHNDCCKGWSKGELLPIHHRKSKQIEIFGNPKDKKDIENYIFNIEDFDPKYLEKFDFRTFINVREAKEIYICIVLRDPFNWAASCLKTGGGVSARLPSSLIIWKKQAQLFLHPEQHNHIIRVNYNEWFSDNTYKNILSDKLNLQSFNKGVNYTSPRGGGSSFDKMRFKNKASQMNILKRWKNYQGSKDYADMFGKETHNLSKRIFGFDISDKKLRESK